MPPATADLGNETDRVTDDTEVHGYTLWLTPDDVEDFQPLPLLDEAGADFDDTLHQWTHWLTPEGVEDPPLSASGFEESEAGATEALEWVSGGTERPGGRAADTGVHDHRIV